MPGITGLWQVEARDNPSFDAYRRLDLFYREAAERHNGAWRGKGYSGEDYREPGHPYQFDLNILGEGSLFEYLATARTEAGRRALAAHLLHPVSADEARARQAAVRELSALPDLREAVATLGETTYSDCNADAANAWLTMAPANFPSWLAPLALLTSSALALLLIVSLLALVPWKVAVPYLAGLLIWHGLLAYVHQSQVRPLLKAGFELEPEIAILHDGLSLLARQSFTAPKLQQLQRRAAAKTAAGDAAAAAQTLGIDAERGVPRGGDGAAVGDGDLLAVRLHGNNVRHADWFLICHRGLSSS